ncbi:O-antigen ligase family protein [Paenibacillus lupini]|uniref:O-antigen ligase family protein n=1 Tax=Paenibacillus lupini TaxID=1450204 RepID=UPI00141DDEE7|nr:O-antigen ligase family protein [Paenibacillus lupini]NIK26281.1 hypothetical protein [Paenibacillus lupini]
MDKLIDTAKVALLKTTGTIGMMLIILFIGVTTTKVAMMQDLWQLSVVLGLTMAAVFLQWANSIAYVPYTIAVWAFYPEIRRLLDWSFGTYSDTPILSLAPLLVSLTMLIPIMKNYKKLSRTVTRIMLIASLVFGYGYLLGVLQFGSFAATYDLINYLSPLLLIAYVNTCNFKNEVRDYWLKSFTFITVLVAVYGIYQYFLIPPWDQFWMIHSEMTSIGQPEPLKVRVFSTLNSPGPTGAFLAYALSVMIMNKKWRAFGFVGLILVAFALMLTLVRSSWIGLVAMLLVYFMQAKSQSKIKLVAVLAVLVMFYQFVLPSLPGADAITTRVQSFGNLSEDNSYNDRLAFTSSIMVVIMSNPIGNGLGSTGLSAKLNTSALQTFDNGYLNVFYTFGIPGGLLFLGLLGYLVVLSLRSTLYYREYSHLAFATMAAALFLLFGANTFPGVGGVNIWFLLSFIFFPLKEEDAGHEHVLRYP